MSIARQREVIFVGAVVEGGHIFVKSHTRYGGAYTATSQHDGRQARRRLVASTIVPSGRASRGGFTFHRVTPGPTGTLCIVPERHCLPVLRVTFK